MEWNGMWTQFGGKKNRGESAPVGTHVRMTIAGSRRANRNLGESVQGDGGPAISQIQP